ncbi:MAG: helix-turn-helix domain-containing protein, partial [Pseudomonadota bacterium]
MSQLAGTGLIPGATAALDDAMNGAGTALRETILADVPAFRSSGNPEILPELGQHVGDHIGEIRRLLAGGEVRDFEFVRTHAQHRAEQRFPLEAILHAYRSGHKFLSHWLRDAAMALDPTSHEAAVSAVADFALEYTNAVSTIATSEYVAQTRLLAEAEGDLRTELLNILLSGYDESDGRIARLMKRAGYLEQRQSYCVVVAQSANASEMENPARAQRIASALSDAVAGTSIRALTGIRDNLVIAVLSAARRQSGWTPAQADLNERLHAMLLVLGPAVLVGISVAHPSTSFVPKALQEATIALDFADVTKRVASFAELPVRSLLVHRGADYVRAASPAWISALINADVQASGTLLQTLRAIADADMNIQKAARILGKHPNTIYHRLERIRDLTSLDGQRYHHLT